MKYDPPKKITEQEILENLKRKNISSEEKIITVLSAIYYGDTVEFSGDILISEFMNSNRFEKKWLKNLFETFYGMYRVDYRIDENIKLLREYKDPDPNTSLEVESIVESLLEYKDMFGK